MTETEKMNLNFYNHQSLATNFGSGMRSVLWLQGCPDDLRDCYPEEAYDRKPKKLVSVADFIAGLPASQIEGVTITGGEPFCQMKGVNLLCRELKILGLGIVIHTGYSLKNLKEKEEDLIREILTLCDVLISYAQEKKLKNSFDKRKLEHENKNLISPSAAIGEIYLFSSRYSSAAACLETS